MFIISLRSHTATNRTSCKDLKKHHPELRSGLHNIVVNGVMLKVYCDMETDGGSSIDSNIEMKAQSVQIENITKADFKSIFDTFDLLLTFFDLRLSRYPTYLSVYLSSISNK